MKYHLPKDLKHTKQNELKKCNKDNVTNIGENMSPKTPPKPNNTYEKVDWDITCSTCEHGTNDPKLMRTTADGKCTNPTPYTKFIPGTGWVCYSFNPKETEENEENEQDVIQ